MSAGARPFAIVAAVPEELAELRRRLDDARADRLGSQRVWRGALGGREVVLAVAGDGAARAERALGEILDRVPCEALLGIGVAGGLTTGLPAGSLVVASSVFDSSGPVGAGDPVLRNAAVAAGAREALVVSAAGVAATPADKRALAGHLAAPLAVVDLESATWVRQAAARGLPWSVLRVVSDASDESLPRFLARCRREDGSVDRRRVALLATAVPTRIPAVVRLFLRVRRAGVRLADAVGAIMVGAGSGIPATASRKAVVG